VAAKETEFIGYQKYLEAQMTVVAEINAGTFDEEVLNADKPVLVDFSAVWCGPCKMLKPVVDQLAEEWSNEMKVVELDVDHSPEIAMRYQIMGVPTLMLFVDGQIRERLTGYQPKDRIASKLAPHLPVA
jgi:thioredoxin 1